MNFIKTWLRRAYDFVTFNLGKAINTCTQLTAPLVARMFGDKEAPAITARVVGKAVLGFISYVALVAFCGHAAVLVLTAITWVLALVLPLLAANLIALALTLVGVHFVFNAAKNVGINTVFAPGFVLGETVEAVAV